MFWSLSRSHAVRTALPLPWIRSVWLIAALSCINNASVAKAAQPASAASGLQGPILRAATPAETAQAEPAQSEMAQSEADLVPPASVDPVASEAGPSPWAGSVELYGFAPLRSTGSSTVRGFSTDLDLNLGQVLRALTGAGSIRGSVEYGRIGLLTDISYVSVAGEEGRLQEIRTRSIEGPLGRRSFTLTPDGQRSLAASVSNIEGIYDLAVRYRFGDRETAVARAGSFAVIPYAGVRFVNMQYNLAVQSNGPGRTLTFRGPRLQGSRTLAGWNLQRQQSFASTVAQPLLGTQAMLFLSPHLRLFARADIGGFGVNNDDDYSWNTQLGLGYAIGNSTQLNVSWRYQHLGGSNSQVPENAYNIYKNGIEAGVKFFF
jgi:opacity protein-like surface antigen